MLEKEYWGLAATLLVFISNGTYLFSTLCGRVKPHVFSWVVWGVLTAIAFFAQQSAGAGAGAWYIAANSLTCFAVAGLAIKRGSFDIKRSDIVAFIGALLAIPVWLALHSPLYAVLVVIAIEAFAYYPTFRKAYGKPREEMAFAYAADALRSLISLPALDSYSLTTLLYPGFLILFNGALVSMLLYRRRFQPISTNTGT